VGRRSPDLVEVGASFVVQPGHLTGDPEIT
jgi:hypothetical protein